MAKKNTDKGTWKEGDLETVKLVIDGKVVKKTKSMKPQGKSNEKPR